MKIRSSVGEKIFNIFNILIMLGLMVVMFYPMWYVVCASFSDSKALMAFEGTMLLPAGFSLDSYMAVFKNPMILHGYKNTMYILIVSLVFNMLLTSIGGYVLSRKEAYFTGFFMKLIIVTMYFSGGLIPSYLLVTQTLKLNNSLWAIILPGAINTYNLVITKTSMMSIPDSLIESAKLDGAGHWRILFKIVIPLSKAILAVVALYYAVAHWNSWFTASIYLNERSKYPLQLVLREVLIQNDSSTMTQGVAESDQLGISETIKYAIIMVSTVPILIFYPFLQRYFVKGTMVGAVKG